MSIPGGMIADKLLGQKKSCFNWGNNSLSRSWGFSVLLKLGRFTLAGIGITRCRLTQPNISTMVGGLYPQGDIRRDGVQYFS
jgi:POT family proton-dependent oligopeptide transporter